MSAPSNQDICICMYASIGAPKRNKQNDDQFTIEVSVSSAAVEKNPARKLSPLIHETVSKAFRQPRQAFLSASPDRRREIIQDVFQGLGAPFALENIVWSLDGTGPGPEGLGDIISNRLLKIAENAAAADAVGCMSVQIRRVERVGPEEYRELRDRVVVKRKQKGALDDWIAENQNDIDFNRCVGFVYELWRISPAENRYFGLKSEKMERSGECAICVKDMKKDSVAIRMPCSHRFHGFCIIKWLHVNLSCPLCRFQL